MKIRAKRQKRRRGKLAFLCAFLRLRTAHGEFDVRKVILHVQNILRMLGDSVCENRLKATDFVCSHGASRRNDQLSLFRPIAYRVKGRSPLTGRGVGAPQARRIAQKRSAYLIPLHCVPGQGAKSLAGARGGSPASAACSGCVFSSHTAAEQERGAGGWLKR